MLPDAFLGGERRERVERLRVRERVAAGHALRRLAHQDPLHRHLEELPGERARNGVDRGDPIGDVPRRAVVANAPPQRLLERVVEHGAVAQHDEQAHHAVGALARHVDDEGIDDLVQGEHGPVDLGGAHAHAAAVDRRVGAAVDDRRARAR